jgi:hypothetical protein
MSTEIEKLFITGLKKHYRFKQTKSGVGGQLMIEDLFDLSLPSLDLLAQSLNAELKVSGEESFIKSRTIANTDLNNRFEIVKYVIKMKLDEEEVKENAKRRRAEEQELLSLIQEKQQEEKRSKSLEDLTKEYNEKFGK